MYIIMIDSGTTNSRIRLVGDDKPGILDLITTKVGVRNTAIDGDNNKLKAAIKHGIEEMLSRNQLVPQSIKYIVASGMITSNLGLYEVPHITAPAELKDFSVRSRLVENTKEFLNIPCLFIPGVRNEISQFNEENLFSINQLDVVRGEEVEAIGLRKQLNLTGKGLMVLRSEENS